MKVNTYFDHSEKETKLESKNLTKILELEEFLSNQEKIARINIPICLENKNVKVAWDYSKKRTKILGQLKELSKMYHQEINTIKQKQANQELIKPKPYLLKLKEQVMNYIQ